MTSHHEQNLLLHGATARNQLANATWNYACVVFEDRDKARRWLEKPKAFFGGKSPQDRLNEDISGAIEVLQRLHTLDNNPLGGE